VEVLTSAPGTAEIARPLTRSPVGEPRWDLAFLGILAYLVIEYTRLAAMFRFLAPLQLGKVAVGISMLGWAVAARTPKVGRRSGIGIDIALAFFLFASFLSALQAHAQAEAWVQLINTVQCCIIYFLVGRIVSSSWRMRVFVLILLLLNLKLAQFGIRAYFAGRAYGRSAEFMASRGVGAGSTGFFANPGDFGVAMCVVWPLAGMLLLAESKRIPRLILLASFAAFSGAILVCGSRGAFLAATLTALVASVRNLRRFGVALLFLMLVPGFFYLLPGGSRDRLRSALHWQEDKTASTRIALWRAGRKMFSDHPIFGVGPANFGQEYATRYAGPGEDPETWVPHSIYIQALSELGLVGTIPLLLLIVSYFRLNARTLKNYRARGKEGQQALGQYMARGLNLAMVGYLLSGAFLAVLYYPHLWILSGLSVGLNTVSVAGRAADGVAGVEDKGQSLALPVPS
jgi:putative inorganic carbon (HCO3(-)) transporter